MFKLAPALLLILAITPLIQAQTTQFTYQGKLTDAAMPANGNYDMRFRLYDNPTPGQGTQQGNPVTNSTVAVTNGIFTVQLDFNPAVFSAAAPLYLQIDVRPAGSSGNYTTLAPRQPLTSAPLAARAVSSASADNAMQLNGVAASQYVLTSDARLANSRDPNPGSGNYVQNTSSAQAGTNFNISGNGTAGGMLSANVVNAATQFKIANNTVLNVTGVGGSQPGFAPVPPNTNTFGGVGAGAANVPATGGFFEGNLNSFFGFRAGNLNTDGYDNSYFGTSAGENATGKFNSYFGASAGRGSSSVNPNSGDSNSFFGISAGSSNSTGGSNTFVGSFAGLVNTTGNGNAYLGVDSGRFAKGNNNSFFGTSSGTSNSANQNNTTGSNNSFFGAQSGNKNTSAINNAFVGYKSGFNTDTGGANTFIGADTGSTNVSGADNTTVGYHSDVAANNLNFSTAIGSRASVARSNSIVLGAINGVNGATSDTNVGVGTTAPKEKFHVANGKIYVDSPGQGVVLKTPDGTKCYEMTVTNTGSLTTTLVACP